jgi:hypothetical protein
MASCSALLLVMSITHPSFKSALAWPNGEGTFFRPPPSIPHPATHAATVGAQAQPPHRHDQIRRIGLPARSQLSSPRPPTQAQNAERCVPGGGNRKSPHRVLSARRRATLDPKPGCSLAAVAEDEGVPGVVAVEHAWDLRRHVSRRRASALREPPRTGFSVGARYDGHCRCCFIRVKKWLARGV